MKDTVTIPATKIRWMIRRDMPAVLDIESNSFDEPWTEEQIEAALRNKNCIAMVACDSDELPLGYMVYELHKAGIVLLNIAVHPKYRLGSIASRMIMKLLSKLSPGKRETLSATVHEANLPAQKFFRACGFKAVQVQWNYYGEGEDGYVFNLRFADLIGRKHP